MAHPKPTPERKSRSGSYVHESQRHTERVVLRLPPEIATRLRTRAAEDDVSMSDYVTRLVETDTLVIE